VTHHPKLPDLIKILDKEFRDEFLSSAVRLGISIQTQVLRGNRSQKEFAAVTGKTQTQISRLENAKSGGVSLQTLIDIASALNIGLSVRFVDYDTMLDQVNDMSDQALQVRTIFQSVEAARLTDFKLIRLDDPPHRPRQPVVSNSNERAWPSTTDDRIALA
jgi:transcriptional regulator with XRE-family HTH domain